MQSLSLLRLIEKFAEIHRQVSLRSLILVFMRFALENGVTGGYVGLPIRETRIGALSSACGRRARFANAQALLAISDFRHAESRTAGRTASILLYSSLCGGVKGCFRMKTASISFSSFLRHFNTPAHANLTKESYNMRVLRREQKNIS